MESELEQKKPKPFQLIYLLDVLSILLGLVVSQLWKGKIDPFTVAPFIGVGYLILAFFTHKKSTSQKGKVNLMKNKNSQ